MASSAKFAAPCAWALVLCGCRASTDIVAMSHEGSDASIDLASVSRQGSDASADLADAPYGDYNPDVPPRVLPIGGDYSPITDPTMFYWKNTYWVFSSGPGISVRSSKDDLKTFQLEKQVFTQNPSWIADKIVAYKVGDLWSPSVVIRKDTIHLYYAASTFSTDCACIGHATAPYSGQALTFTDDQSPMICSNLTSTCVTGKAPGADAFTAIDPAVIVDEADNLWMVFGSWGSGIQMIALDSSGKRLDPNSSPVVVAARAPGDSKAIQAASLYHWRDYYYLFVSFDNSPNHVLRVGRAKNVTGPYLDSDGKDMAGGGGRVLLKGDASFNGPGSNMVFDDPGGQRLNVYHAYDQNNTAVLRIGQLFFDNDGWPVSAGP